MDLNRETMKKLMFLIAFTVLLLVGIQRLDVVIGRWTWAVAIFFPFMFGGAVAFFLNVPCPSWNGRCSGRSGRKNGRESWPGP